MKPDASDRNNLIFDMIVRSYIETAEPVGSRTISKHADIGLSSASIRNVMADLEELGFLKQPHTSAGRVPTDKGYRYWVDKLMRPEGLSAKEKQHIVVELESARSFEAMAERVCKVLSEITENAVIVYVKSLKRVSFLNHLLEELVKTQKLADYLEEEPEMFMEGASRMFEQPEFQDIQRMRALLHVFDEKAEMLRTLIRDMEDRTVQVRIGRENELDVEDMTVINKDWLAPIGGLAVVGPTRMNYPKVVSAVDFATDVVSKKMGQY